MDHIDIDKLIEETVNKTIIKLRMAGLLNDAPKTAAQKTADLLRHYPHFKLSDQEYTKELCHRIEMALDTIRSDYYFEIISLYYFEGMTREEIAGYFNTSETTISRNKRRLVDEVSAVLFSDEVIQEIFM